MIGDIIKAALLVYCLRLIVRVVGETSPCPNYFVYEEDPETKNFTGKVSVPSPPKGVPLKLSVVLSVPAVLSKYVGKLELGQSQHDAVKAIYDGGSLLYRVHFPLHRPIPTLNDIWFNEDHICTGTRISAPYVTVIVLNHTLLPPGVTSPPDPTTPVTPTTLAPFKANNNVFLSNPNLDLGKPKKPDEPRMNFPFLPPTTPKPVTTTAKTSVQTNYRECGRINVDRVNPLVAGGSIALPGQWPWLVAIFIVRFEFEYRCAGSLVTNRHVITAAHCCQYKSMNLPVVALLVSVGRYQLRDWKENGSVTREVRQYKFHPDYISGETADSDLAILTLREEVEFSELIRPICLWKGSANLKNVIGKIGYVVGWGRDELGNPYVMEPRQTKSPIVQQNVCISSHPKFAAVSSNRTFCAGYRDGSGPCNGDSGSGFVIYDPMEDRYYLRGIVSRSLLDLAGDTCDLTQYVVYVDVAKYKEWVTSEIASDNSPSE
ncbi:serine protease gd [Xylocopa sonorina]|uniref:serine protease gd n=1 Tax=Xylocopa sonorina TaxID=1818115 RepID=UPI00403AC1E4